MKVVGINGSARKDGNTANILCNCAPFDGTENDVILNRNHLSGYRQKIQLDEQYLSAYCFVYVGISLNCRSSSCWLFIKKNSPQVKRRRMV